MTALVERQMEGSTIGSQEDPVAVYKRFDAYNFTGDEDFQAGLASILASNARTTPDVIQMAKLFYYAKTIEPLDYNDYMAWKKPTKAATPGEIDAALASEDMTRKAEAPSHQRLHGTRSYKDHCRPIASGDAETPYPATFAEIVELIKSGKPIPGIKVIEDKTADGEESISTAVPRAKPWETSAVAKEVNFFETLESAAQDELSA